jgi:hypothetical protein
MIRRRNTTAAVVFAAVILVGNGASAQGLADLEGEWMGTVAGTVIMSDALEVDIHEVHGDHVDDGHWSMGLPPAAAALLGHDELSGDVTGGHGMPPELTFEVDQIEGCEVEVEVETIEADWWEGHWHTHGCGINDSGDMMLTRAGAVPALPLVGVLVLAAILVRRGWRGLQDRR